MIALVVLSVWMPLENETGRNPGREKATSAPSGATEPSGRPTGAPAFTVTVVPSGSVSGVPAVRAMAGPLFGRLPVTATNSVARVLPGITVSGCKDWPLGGLG